jgi:predicted transcriptional regulator of viral defense system
MCGRRRCVDFAQTPTGSANRLHARLMDVPQLHRRRDLRADGFSDHEVRRFLRAGELTAVRRGAYVLGAPPGDAVLRHVLDVRAAMEELADDAAISHVSAAVLHGLPIWAIALDRVHVTRPRRTGGRAGTRVHVHTAPLADDEIDLVDGMPVTTVGRTVIDLARTKPFEQAVAIADAALHAGLAEAQLNDALLRATRWPGCPAARRAVGFADPASESVGESRSRVAIARAGLPTPVLQCEVFDPRGQLVGRTDFGWLRRRAVGEFDGQMKYGRLLRPGQDPGEVVFAEKRREDALRDLGFSVVRWTWGELGSFAPVAERLRRRLCP